ncbi:MAG TPA: M28 family peptidase [Gemmatimonadales bacterium]|nr:M28 family peptidase [Gemmatimonadales bacterium]
MAGPREAGTDATAIARRQISQFLAVLGYDVTEQPFRFLPGALNAFSLVGAGLVWLTLLELPLLLLPSIPGFGAPLVWFSGAAAIALLAWRIGSGLPTPGAEEREDANLIAVRPGATVRRWIVAHLDTKAQGQSMAGRLVVAWLVVLVVLAMSALVLVRWLRASPPANGWVLAAAALTIVAGALTSRGKLQGGSLGARDTGSGVLAALIAAEKSRDDAVGFIFTGAEEFGLVGARILARSGFLDPAASIINLDTLDGRGNGWVVHHDAAGARLAGALREAPFIPGRRANLRRLPLGILTDSLVFARRGHPAVTLARLDWGTLRVLHTVQDAPESLDTATAERVGAYLAQLPPA